MPARRLLVAGLLLTGVLLLPAPAPASWHAASMIVPSSNIGPFHLGMTEADVRPLLRTAPCGVMASYAESRTSRLETNCGGAYRTPERIQVGEGPTRIFLAYGAPQDRAASDFAGVRAEWLYYTREGIAFRVVYGDGPGNALIQAIAVFRGTAPSPARPVPPAFPPDAPPAIPPAQTPGVGQ